MRLDGRHYSLSGPFECFPPHDERVCSSGWETLTPCRMRAAVEILGLMVLSVGEGAQTRGEQACK